MEDALIMKTRGRYAVAALAMTGMTAAAALLGTGAASANPAPRAALLGTTCSFAQIDRAMHAEFPTAAARLDAHPRHRARLQRLFDLPPTQREAALHQFMATHPGLAAIRHAMMRQWMSAHPDRVARHRAAAIELANTCHRF
jgi:hemophore-related protein